MGAPESAEALVCRKLARDLALGSV
jgi:hypothetical protein